MIEKLKNILNGFNTRGSQKKPRWREFEDRVGKWHKLRTYRIQEQKCSKSTGKRLDRFGINPKDPKDRIAVESKWTIKARNQHIDQMQKKYTWPFFPKKKVLAYPQNVEMSEKFKQRAKEKGIDIYKPRIKKEKERSGFLGLFGKKEYKR